jgi:uncharacterized protein
LIMSIHLFAFLCMLLTVKSDIQGWINEFHYRNYKKDQNLFLEIVGPVGKEAWEYLIVLYQGRDGSQFNEALSLSGFSFSSGIEGDFGFIKYSLPNKKGAIRNGKVGSDGIALTMKNAFNFFAMARMMNLYLLLGRVHATVKRVRILVCMNSVTTL